MYEEDRRVRAFILDTSVIIHDPTCFDKFEDNDVIIPFVVVMELDRQRKEDGYVGAQARIAIRFLEKLRESNPDMLHCPLSTGGQLSVFGATKYLLESVNKRYTVNDNLIIELALQFKDVNDAAYEKIALVSKDMGMRILGASLGIITENYESDLVIPERLWSGVFSEQYLSVEIPVISHLKSHNKIEAAAFNAMTIGDKMLGNQQYAIVKDNILGEKPRTKIVKNSHGIVEAINDEIEVFGIKGNNARQRMALDALYDPRVNLMLITGASGTGKTLLALAAGLAQTWNPKGDQYLRYSQIVGIKPIVPVGNDIGFLPGSKDSKLQAWLQPYFDNLEFIAETGKLREGVISKQSFGEWLIQEGVIALDAMTYLRGRSITKSWIILDEVQNLSPQQIKTALTRAGAGSKVICLADTTQIDAPYLDNESCGAAHILRVFGGKDMFSHVELNRSERSYLAGLAAQLL